MLDYHHLLTEVTQALHVNELARYVTLHYLMDVVDFFSLPTPVQHQVEDMFIVNCTDEDRTKLGCVCGFNCRQQCYHIVQTTLFGKNHSYRDNPAIVYRGSKYCALWYKAGFLHRDHDLPAEKFFNTHMWYIRGINRRANIDLPCFVSPTKQVWRDEIGLVHRDNDLPACIDNTIRQWWHHGHLLRHVNDVN